MPIVILMAAVGIAYVERTSIAHLIPYIRKDLAYDSAALGYVLSAFGWGYVIALPVSGFIITRFGHQRVLAVGAIAWVVAAAGFACATNLYELVVARFALGIAEAPLFPLFVSWIAITSGRNSTSAKIGVVEGMSYLGMAFSGPLTVFAANNMGWRAAYAGVGLLALPVAAAALFLPNKSEPHASKSHSVTNLTTIRRSVYHSFPLRHAHSDFFYTISAKRFIRPGCQRFWWNHMATRPHPRPR